jgi:hypothetical protein
MLPSSQGEGNTRASFTNFLRLSFSVSICRWESPSLAKYKQETMHEGIFYQYLHQAGESSAWRALFSHVTYMIALTPIDRVILGSERPKK